MQMFFALAIFFELVCALPWSENARCPSKCGKTVLALLLSTSAKVTAKMR